MKPTILLLLASLLISGCGILSPEDSSSGVIMPLAVGNTWIGKQTTRDANGSVIAETYDTLTIVGTVDAGEETWYKGSDGAIYMNRKDGLWKGDCPGPQLKYPGKTGDKFGITPATTVLIGGMDEPVSVQTFVRIASRDTSLTVPAGSYRCYHYRRGVESSEGKELENARMIHEHEFYAPNIGPIRRSSYDGNDTWELVHVSLKQ